MPYIEVSRIKTHADKIHSQLEIVLSEKPQLYSKTKQKYKDLAISLLSSVESIAAILQQDSLASLDNKSAEFDDNISVDVSDLSAAIQTASDKIDSYTSFVSSDSSVVSNNVNKDTLRRYGQVLEQASNYNFECVEADECAYVLNRWFKARFSSPAKDSKFKYNLAYLPEWITNIIVLYGHYHRKGDTAHFVDMMISWCESLSVSSVKWAVPYEVHQLSKSTDPNIFTMDAVILGDLLMDGVLYQLTESMSPDILANLECYPVASRVKSKNPALFPEIRTRLAKRDSLLSEYSFTSSERRR